MPNTKGSKGPSKTSTFGQATRTKTTKKANSKAALERFKYEAANEVGVTLSHGYNGNLTASQAGSIGGQMVKRMIESYESDLKSGTSAKTTGTSYTSSTSSTASKPSAPKKASTKKSTKKTSHSTGSSSGK